jgi:DNA processing protein
MSRGVHRLLREGAELVEDPDEVLASLGLETPESECGAGPEASDLGRRILATLHGETLSVEQIAAKVGRSLAAVLVEIVTLEMAGRLDRTPGGLYRRLDDRS